MPQNIHPRTSAEIQIIAIVTILVALIILPASAAAEPPSHVTISDVTVSEDEPETGEMVYITPEITNSGNAEYSVEIDHIKIRTGKTTSGIHDRASYLGTLGPGDSFEVPLVAEFNEPGMVTASLRVVGTVHRDDRERGFYVKRPVHLDVQEPSTETATPPRLSMDTGGGTVEPGEQVQVKVSNGDDDGLDDLRLTVEGPGIEEQTRVHPRIDEWNSTTFNFTTYQTQKTSGEVTATLKYDGGEVAISEGIEVSNSQTTQGPQTSNPEQETKNDSGSGNTNLLSVLGGGLLTGILVVAGGRSALR